MATGAPGQTADEFSPLADGAVHALAITTNGSVIMGGEFTTVSGATRSGLVRVDSGGVVDPDFTPSVAGEFAYVAALTLEADGKLLVGGYFQSLAGRFRSCLGRLNPDGTFDETFDTSADSDVYGILPQPDGRILVWGNFLFLGNQARAYIGRMQEDGSPDTNFTATVNDQVFAAAVQADGKILLGGLFSLVNNKDRNGLARLNADGTLDESFNPDPGNFATVSCLVVQPDGQILVAGRFSQLAGKPRTNLGRLNADGTLDEGFAGAASGGTPVLSMALQADGRVVLGGQLTSLNGQARTYLGRLEPDGKLDTSFVADADAGVSALALDPNGNLLVGGGFAELSGQPRSGAGRLTIASGNTERIVTDGVTVAWVRNGTLPEFRATGFEFSTNGTDWVLLGPGTPSPAGWTVSASLEPNTLVRARGQAATGRRNGSAYVVEQTHRLTIDAPPQIVVNDAAFGWSQNQFGFNVRGVSGQTAVVEASADLVGWTPLFTNRFTTPTFYFSDPGDAVSRRNYRVRLQ